MSGSCATIPAILRQCLRFCDGKKFTMTVDRGGSKGYIRAFARRVRVRDSGQQSPDWIRGCSGLTRRHASLSPRRAGASRAAIVVEAPVLFDKWFEERETQAAESWRTQRACQRPWVAKRLWRYLRFSHHNGASHTGRNPGSHASRVKVPVTQKILGEIPSKPTRIRTFNLRV